MEEAGGGQHTEPPEKERLGNWFDLNHDRESANMLFMRCRRSQHMCFPTHTYARIHDCAKMFNIYI